MRTSVYKIPFFLILILHLPAFGQSYGLGFAGNEMVQDKRTGLDLSSRKPFCFRHAFELSFEMSFLPDYDNYFGYICRVIVNDQENIDLMYDRRISVNQHFRVVTGEKFSHIAFDIDSVRLFSSWNQIRLRFDPDQQLLTLLYNGHTYTERIAVKKNSCCRILFGANDYKGFKTTDVPPMKIRNVQLSEGGKPLYSWPLDEDEGLQAYEQEKRRDAAVVNPLWIRKLHHEWQHLQEQTIAGPASVAFDPATEQLYIAGSDSMLTYSVQRRTLTAFPYKSGKRSLLKGSQSLYDTASRLLLNTFFEEAKVSALDVRTGEWMNSGDVPIETNHIQFNKFYCPADSSLYLLGGYGHFFYKNDVRRYHFPTQSWQQLQPGGSFFTPRYLAALGGTAKGAYIIGGYGSTSGQQLLNPKNLYDLLYFDVAEKTFTKRYDLKVSDEDFVFANSLVVDEKNGSWYALIFPKHRYNTQLQLIKGSLTQPVFERVGDSLPYLFHDTRSFADLFYCPASKRFIAVTLLNDGQDRTAVNIYSLYDPPIVISQPSATIPWRYLLYAGLLAAAGIVLFIVYRRRRRMPLPAKNAEAPETIPVPEEAERRNVIFLFGDLQLFDAQGNDITKYFSPLIKELFLVILLYTLRWERGISPDKLNELLWFGKSSDKARNNRAVNIAKLKSILDKMNGCTLQREGGYWKINIDDGQLYTDYHAYLDIIKDKKGPDRQKISSLAKIISRGAFLANVEYEWLDRFKSEISNEIIDICLHFADTVNIADEAEFLIQLADYIFYFDPVNEEAMAIKSRALVRLGKHSLAKSTFDGFCKEYKQLYGEEFTKDFNAIKTKLP